MALVDPGFARRAQTVGVRSANQNGSRPQADCFRDVAAASNASVHQDFGAAADGLHDFRQRAQGGRHAVELPAAVIGDDYSCSAFVERAPARRRRSARP